MTGDAAHIEFSSCTRCGWGKHELVRSLYACSACSCRFYAEEPCPSGTNQDVACPRCHEVETGLAFTSTPDRIELTVEKEGGSS